MFEAIFLLAVTALAIIGVIVYTLEELRVHLEKDKKGDQ